MTATCAGAARAIGDVGIAAGRLRQLLVDDNASVNLWLTPDRRPAAGPPLLPGAGRMVDDRWIDQSPPGVRLKVDALRVPTAEGSGLCPVSP